MASAYPTHIEVPVQYTPTAELDHSQLMKLYELSMPAIEDLSWEDVVTNTFVKLKAYSKVYEMEIFFTALLHSRYIATSSTPEEVRMENRERGLDSKSRIHPDVRELALEDGLAFNLSQRYGIDTIASVVHFASKEGGKWTDEENALSAALVLEEIANAAERRVSAGNGAADESSSDTRGIMDCLRNSGPWKGWCGFKSGVHLK